VPQAGGTSAAFDLGALYEDLHAASRQAGVHEEWLADQVAFAVELELGRREALGARSDAAAIDSMVIQALVDVGYPDVGAAFGQSRGSATATPVAGPQSVWDVARVRRAVDGAWPLSDETARRLTEQVMERLDGLGFERVTETLILAVAEHALAVATGRQDSPAQHPGWLMPPGYWETFFSGHVAVLVRADVLTVHPVSRLFPVVRLTLDALRLALHSGAAPLTELQFFPVLARCTTAAAEALERLHHEAAALAPAARSRPAHLVVAHLDVVSRESFGAGSRVRARARERELEGVVRQSLEGRKTAEFLVSIL